MKTTSEIIQTIKRKIDTTTCVSKNAISFLENRLNKEPTALITGKRNGETVYQKVTPDYKVRVIAERMVKLRERLARVGYRLMRRRLGHEVVAASRVSTECSQAPHPLVTLNQKVSAAVEHEKHMIGNTAAKQPLETTPT
jgi:hypothetical protein